jgi:branched-chain amino acid transport system permease protein
MTPVLLRRLTYLALLLLGVLYVTAQSGYGLFLVVASACYAIGAMSIVLITGWAGQLSLAQAALMGLGAFLMGVYTGVDVATGDHRLPFMLGLVLVPITVAPIAVLVGLPALRVRGLHFALVSLAAAYAADTALFTSTNFTGYAENLNVNRPEIFGISFRSDRGYLVLVLVFLLIGGVILRNIGRSRLGRSMMAVRDSEVAASISGISVAGVKIVSFAIAGMYAALAGALYAGVVGNVYSVFRTFDVSKSLFILATVVVGGLTTVTGALLAGVSYIYLPEYLGRVVNPVLSQAVGGVLLAVVVLTVRNGIASLPAQIAERWHARQGGPPGGPVPTEEAEVDLRSAGIEPGVRA